MYASIKRIKKFRAFEAPPKSLLLIILDSCEKLSFLRLEVIRLQQPTQHASLGFTLQTFTQSWVSDALNVGLGRKGTSNNGHHA
jgi:hypothetical protein